MTAYHCGIDIGSNNLAFAFVEQTTNALIVYTGELEDLTRYELNKNPTTHVFAYKKTWPKGDKLIALIDSLPEMQTTVGFIVEFQMANQTFSHIAGIIFGYLRGKGIPGSLMGGQTRKRYASSTTEDDSMSQVDVKALTGRKVPENKVASIAYVNNMYPAFLAYVVIHTRKIDDICDSIVYATMSRDDLTSSLTVSKAIKRAKAANC